MNFSTRYNNRENVIPDVWEIIVSIFRRDTKDMKKRQINDLKSHRQTSHLRRYTNFWLCATIFLPRMKKRMIELRTVISRNGNTLKRFPKICPRSLEDHNDTHISYDQKVNSKDIEKSHIIL